MSAAWPARRVVAILALAAVYYAAAKFGLALAYENSSVTAVWPPTGIALAALLLGGYRLWPGVALGPFIVCATTTSEPLAVACGVATRTAVGDTGRAVLGGRWVVRDINFVSSCGAFGCVVCLH